MVYSQEFSRETISSAAVVFNREGPSITYTVGEIVLETSPNSWVSENSGVVSFTDTTLQPNSQNATNYNYGIRIYPNPTKAALNIKMEEAPNEAYVAVYTISGDYLQRVICAGRDKILIDFSGYATGIYLLSFQYPDQGTVASFIIQKN